MDERQLRAFVAVAELGRMDHAAKALGYSSPAVSYQLRCLERSLGVRLCNRNAAGARLTREGEMALPSARALLVLMEAFKNSVDRPGIA